MLFAVVLAEHPIAFLLIGDYELNCRVLQEAIDLLVPIEGGPIDGLPNPLHSSGAQLNAVVARFALLQCFHIIAIKSEVLQIGN